MSGPLESVVAALLAYGVEPETLRAAADIAEGMTAQNPTHQAAQDMINRMDQLIAEDPDRRTLVVYRKALAQAVADGDDDRMMKGLDLIAPLVAAHEHLDLTG